MNTYLVRITLKKKKTLNAFKICKEAKKTPYILLIFLHSKHSAPNNVNSTLRKINYEDGAKTPRINGKFFPECRQAAPQDVYLATVRARARNLSRE